MKYYAVKWSNIVRWTGKKVASEEDAKIKCFGMSTSDMQVIDLGARKKEALKRLKLMDLLLMF